MTAVTSTVVSPCVTTTEPVACLASSPVSKQMCIRDRAEGERSERAAKAAEERKNELVVYLAHDIKTPLTSIIGYLTLLEESPDLPVDVRARYTGITLAKAYRLEELLDEFFEITRYNLQTIPIERSRFVGEHGQLVRPVEHEREGAPLGQRVELLYQMCIRDRSTMRAVSVPLSEGRASRFR